MWTSDIHILSGASEKICKGTLVQYQNCQICKLVALCWPWQPHSLSMAAYYYGLVIAQKNGFFPVVPYSDHAREIFKERVNQIASIKAEQVSH